MYDALWQLRVSRVSVRVQEPKQQTFCVFRRCAIGYMLRQQARDSVDVYVRRELKFTKEQNEFNEHEYIRV